MATTPPPPQPLDLNRLVRTVIRRKWVVLACVVLIPGAVYALSTLSTKTYRAAVVLQVQASAVDTSLFEGGSSTPQTGAIAAAARLVRTSGVAREAAHYLRPARVNPSALLGSITVTSDETAGFITITASARSGPRAAGIANAFANATVASRSSQARRRVERAIAALSDELKSHGGNQTSRDQLSQQLQRLRAVKAAQGSNAQIVEPASIPKSPSSPKPVRNTLVALFIALVLGIVLAFVLERLDRRIRSPHELEEATGLPLLAAVPGSAFPDQEPTRASDEAFQTLRAALTYFNVDRPLKTIIVASPVKGDGKTTVATNLVISLARSGKRVILVDADLRRPQAATRLGVNSDVGLGAVLAGEATLEDVIVDLHVASDGGGLSVLPAGLPPPNPSELLGSERMRSVLRQLGERCDVVVIDSTPMLPVSDILPLIRDASGIIAVSRLGGTTTDSVRRFQEVVTMAGGLILGVVATNARAPGFYDGYGYGYGYGGYGYGSEPNPGAAAQNGGSAQGTRASVR